MRTRTLHTLHTWPRHIHVHCIHMYTRTTHTHAQRARERGTMYYPQYPRYGATVYIMHALQHILWCIYYTCYSRYPQKRGHGMFTTFSTVLKLYILPSIVINTTLNAFSTWLRCLHIHCVCMYTCTTHTHTHKGSERKNEQERERERAKYTQTRTAPPLLHARTTRPRAHTYACTHVYMCMRISCLYLDTNYVGKCLCMCAHILCT